MAKEAKSVGAFNSLPDHILCQILSFLPTKDAARTSVLSPRWRYLFLSSIHILDFRACLRSRKKDDNFFNFVDRFFSTPDLGRLECFRVSYDSLVNDLSLVDYRPWDYEYLRFHGWICVALRRGVKEIVILSLQRKRPLTLPALLFNSHSLVTLKLEVFGVNNIPTNACLPNLKTLHFRFFEFLDGHSVLKLISSCPVLEDLAFDTCQFHKISEIIIHSLSLKRLVLDFGVYYDDSRRGLNVIEFDAPNLIYLQYIDGKAEGYTSSEMKSLETAVIGITLLDNNDRVRAANLLRKIRNVQSLYLQIQDVSTKFFLAPIDPMLAFNNIVELEFSSRCIGDLEGTWFMEFLHRMPSLKTLILDLSMGFMPLPTTTVPWCLLSHIKKIEINYFDRKEYMFKMVSYFLKHASVLEVLIVRYINARGKELSTAIEKLLSLPKKSKKCDIMTPQIFR